MRMLKKLLYLLKISEADEILRRYFVINTFDGIMTTLGVLIGGAILGSLDNAEIIFVAISAAIAMSVSGIGAVFLSERAERENDLRELERNLLKKLKGSVWSQASTYSVLLAALVDCITPLLSSLILLLPFFFIQNPMEGLKISFFIAISLLFALGSYLGKISKRNLIFSGLQMVAVGLIAMLIIFSFKIF